MNSQRDSCEKICRIRVATRTLDFSGSFYTAWAISGRVLKLAASGYEIKLANSKRPDSIRDLARDVGATAVSKEEAVLGVDAIIVSIPLAKYPDLASLLSQMPADVVVIDTPNYYPFRDGEIEAIDSGKPESVWVSEQIGRPVVKAWNALLAETLVSKGQPVDALDAGSLIDSWRQQPGTPAYCTELSIGELKPALDGADKARATQNRDALMKFVISAEVPLTHEQIVAKNRATTAKAAQ